MSLFESSFVWLENHTFPCPFKMMTGCDCPGCGLQRSILQMIRGNIQESIQMHPAGIPMVLLLIFIFLQLKMKWSFGSRITIIGIAIILLLSFIHFILKWNAGVICS